jgi:hypothetical protein
MDTAAIAAAVAAAGVRLLAGGPFLCRGPSALTPHFLSTAGNQTVNHLNSPYTRPQIAQNRTFDVKAGETNLSPNIYSLFWNSLNFIYAFFISALSPSPRSPFLSLFSFPCRVASFQLV